MSSITIEELKKLPAESYQIIDVRDEIEISHGAVKGALACKPEEIMENPEVDKTRKLVICCSRGINSKEIAKKLEEEGLDAVSLEKGYIAWLMDAMKSSQDEDFAKNVEISLRKKFKKKIVVNVSKKHTSTKITFNKKVSKIHMKIRPYKKIKGKKTYGRWVKTVGNRIY